MDVGLWALKRLSVKNLNPDLKLILMSAMLKAQPLRQYFLLPRSHPASVQVATTQGSLYDITGHFVRLSEDGEQSLENLLQTVLDIHGETPVDNPMRSNGYDWLYYHADTREDLSLLGVEPGNSR